MEFLKAVYDPKAIVCEDKRLRRDYFDVTILKAVTVYNVVDCPTFCVCTVYSPNRVVCRVVVSKVYPCAF